jgi:vitamin B12 transporter
LAQKAGDKKGGCADMRKLILSLFASFVLFSSPSAAEDKKDQAVPASLQHEIVVTATRIETPAKEVASSVTVISRQEIEKSNRTSVLEILRDIAGLAVIQNGGSGGASSVFLRGANSEHVLIMMDGVELNDPMNPSRSYDLAHFSLENVEQIEVLRGPQSTLYGSDALGGVINILTRKGRGKPQISLAAQAGSFATFAGSAGLAGSAGPAHFSLGLSRFASAGISAASTAYAGNVEKDGYQNLSFSGRAGLAFADGFEADVFVRTVKAKTEIDNFGGPYGDDPNSVQDYSSLFLRGQLRTLLASGRWEQKLGISFVGSERRHDNPVDELHPDDSEKGLFKSRLLKIDWQNNLFIHPANTLTFGADISREEGESEYTSFSVFGPYESDFPKRSADQVGLYVQDQWKLANRFFASAGFRLDTHSRIGLSVTYRLAPAYFIEKTQTKFKASLGTGIKSPSLYQLYGPRTFWGPVGNENLRAEGSLGWDVGVEQYFLKGTALAGITFFRNDFRNLIDFDSSLGYVNIGRARTRGIEAFAEARAGRDLRGRVSYTRLEAKDLDEGSALLRRPREKFAALFDGTFVKKWAASLSVVFTGRRPDQDFSAYPARDVTLPGYWLIGASLSCDIVPRLQAFIRLDNLLDVRYETVFGYGSPGFSASGGINLGLGSK